jgi:hypothetical protein
MLWQSQQRSCHRAVSKRRGIVLSYVTKAASAETARPPLNDAAGWPRDRASDGDAIDVPGDRLAVARAVMLALLVSIPLWVVAALGIFWLAG